MSMSQPADLAANSFFTHDVIVFLHHHVEIGTDEPQWRAIEIEQRVEVRTLADCELHEGGPIVFEQFVNLGDYNGLARRCYRIHERDSFLRRSRDDDRATAQFSIPEIVVSIINAAEWISVFDCLDSSEPGKFDDFTKVDRAAIHAGGELSAPGHFV